MSHTQRAPEAFCSSDLFEEGIGYVCVSRFKSGGRVEIGVFLVDVFCLGVKDAVFRQLSAEEYEEFLEELFVTGRTEMAPAEARKLVEQAVAYAAKLGLAPAADYKKGARVFGGIRADDWPGDFTFGKDGKPFFISGSGETPARCQQILGALERSCGPGNYDYLIGEELDEDDDLRISAGLEAMADEMRRNDPNRVVITTPAGLPKMADLLTDVAEPFIDEAEGLEEIRTLFDLTMLAWNYPLVPEELQLKTKSEIHSQAGEVGVRLLQALIDRRLELYPADRRLVSEVEVSEGPNGRYDVRVASTLNLDDLPKDLELPKE